MGRHLLIVALLSMAVLLPRNAAAGEWGCEVLLCAASSDPSWHGVSECHPPMEKLISAMKRPGFSWPTCPEGGAGKPGFEAYADCPIGSSPAVSPDSIGSHSSGDLSQCKRTVTSCTAGSPHAFDNGNKGRALPQGGVTRVYRNEHSCIFDEYSARPRRSDPYYFDIKDEGSGNSTRHYFDLNL
jgi:hypothetical protein